MSVDMVVGNSLHYTLAHIVSTSWHLVWGPCSSFRACAFLERRPGAGPVSGKHLIAVSFSGCYLPYHRR